jgi:hypothetical protein
MSETQHATEAANEAPTIESIKHKLVDVRKRLLEIHASSTSGLAEIQGIADKFKASGKPVQAKFGDEILAHVETAVSVLDLATIADEMRSLYGSIKLLIASSSEETEAELEVLRSIAADNTKQQLALLRPNSPIFPANEQSVTDVFVCHNDPTAVSSRLQFIVDRDGDAIGVAVKTSTNVDAKPVANLFYFSDYYELCDKVCGRELVVDETSNDGVFVYRAVVQIAVDLADSIVSQFGGLNASLASSRDEGGDQLGSKYETLVPVSEGEADAEIRLAEDADAPVDSDPDDFADAQDTSGDLPVDGAFEVDESLDESSDGDDSLASESTNAVNELSESFDDALAGVDIAVEG